MRSLKHLSGASPSRAPFTDPSPTRWAYRYQRLMLTPSFRALVRVGVPIMLIVAMATSWFSQADNRAALVAKYEEVKIAFQQRPEFMVSEMEINGANVAVAAAISGIVTFDYPISSWDVDLSVLRESIVELSAVEDVVVRIRTGGTLEIAVTERSPVAIWRHVDGLRLIDAQGNMISMIPSRGDRSDLPLIAGDGAMEHIEEAMQIFAAVGPVYDRVRGLVRMGERRWDLVLDRDQRILLPTQEPVAALDRVIALHLSQEMLDRDIAVVDMRNAARPTVRLSDLAVTGLRRVGAAAQSE